MTLDLQWNKKFSVLGIREKIPPGGQIFVPIWGHFQNSSKLKIFLFHCYFQVVFSRKIYFFYFSDNPWGIFKIIVPIWGQFQNYKKMWIIVDFRDVLVKTKYFSNKFLVFSQV